MKKELTTYAATILISFFVGLVLGVICQRDFESKKVNLKVQIDSVQKSRITKLELLLTDYRKVHQFDSIKIAERQSITEVKNYYQIKENELKNDTNELLVVARFRLLLAKNRSFRDSRGE